MITVRAEFGAAPRAQIVTIREHRVVADEQADLGGSDAGPSPSELLLAALASCVGVTLQMYAGRKGWDLRQARVELTGGDEEGRYVIRRRLTLEGDLDAEQRARLTEIAGRCPVSRRLTRGVEIRGVE